ncbi:MAG: low molecular weight phosphotyrosine protein phosphatase [Eubacteriales bacterium]|nr:low molecular weight phosphotyrosine protein phosphatase [Eubacteriales bacterium]
MKILFVCHGNICRSPMAEFIFKELVRRHGGDFTVASAATSSEELGNPIYPPARAEMRAHGIPFGPREAVQLRRADYGKWDLLIGMDEANVRNMKRLFGGDPEGKIRKLLSFADSTADVADPWYSGSFDVAYRDIVRGCEALYESLTGKPARL